MPDVAAGRARLASTFRISPGPIADALTARASEAAAAAQGLWRRDASVWSADAGVQKSILNRLGWLTSPQLMADSRDRLIAFADAIKRDGITDVVLLGMGGSSLAPEVLHRILGVSPGFPRFHMLDSTDPAAIAAATTTPAHTLYLVSSKSGTTIEPNSLAAHFRSALEGAGVKRWADHFVAITDEGTELATRARSEGFRDLFINPTDIGGRYSAMSFFGLVPAALMGQDIGAMIDWSLAMLAASESAVSLGLAIGAAAAAGRDKLTLVLPDSLEPFGLWVEQLIAESTGKHGTGIVPIAGETLARPSMYGGDRFFVRLRVPAANAETIGGIDSRALEAAQLPVADIELPELPALGAEFVRWEIATAVAGALLHINPFDEPNVQQAKDATKALLATYKSVGRLPVPTPDATLDGGATLTLSTAAKQALDGRAADSLLTLIGDHDYFALLAYLGPDAGLAEELRALRLGVRDRTRAATMFGYGPRYLHSTGQLHKGGPNTGVFVLISATPRSDLAIPGESFSFATLEHAQALGDFSSLDATGRRALHIHLPAPDRALVHRIAGALLAGLPGSPG